MTPITYTSVTTQEALPPTTAKGKTGHLTFLAAISNPTIVNWQT